MLNEATWHGALAAGQGFELPMLVASSNEEARPGYDAFTATEYLDSASTLTAKVKLLAGLIRQHTNVDNAPFGGVVIYTGAGISTASGIPDYASRSSNSQAPHLKSLGPGNRPTKTGRVGGLAALGSRNRLDLCPSLGHKAIAALERKGLVQNWVQQNHDRLAQKAGFPQEKLNEIHGAWGDLKNPVLMMDDSLRPDLLDWLQVWATRASLAIAIGTSLCGMTSDMVADVAASRPEGDLVIINLQRTRLDSQSSLRIWGLADDVLRLLCKELAIAVPDPAARKQGEDWVERHPSCKFNTNKRTSKDPI